MSLFLKNLPKSFFRAVVSSRPIFNKATSLFPSIASHAHNSPKFPLLAVSKIHNRNLWLGNVNEDKRKSLYKKYGLHNNERGYFKKTKKTTKKTASSKPSRKPSGPVNCTVHKGIVECTIDCEQLSASLSQTKVSGKDSQTKTKVEKCQPKTKKETPKPKKKLIPKYTKEGIETQRRDVKALTGTWVSRKCIKFDFSAKSKDKCKDAASKPIKLEDPKSVASVPPCKASSKTLARKASQDKKKVSSQKSERSEDPCKQIKTSEEVCQKEDPCEKTVEKPDSKEVCSDKKETSESQAAIETCKESNKPKSEKKASSRTKSKKGKSGEAKKTKSADKTKDKDCKPCSPKKGKKSATKKVAKKSYTPPKRKQHKKKKDPGVAECNKEQIATAANSSLVVSTYSKITDAQSREIVEKLKKELEECRKSKTKGEDPCVDPPKLDAQTPKQLEQDKDIISGSKSFIKSVCDGIFKHKPSSSTPQKSKSIPTVKKKKVDLKQIKSADAKLDCDKLKKEDEKKTESVKPCSYEEATKKSDQKKVRKKMKTPCTYEAPKMDKKSTGGESVKKVCGSSKADKQEKKKDKRKLPCEAKAPKLRDTGDKKQPCEGMKKKTLEKPCRPEEMKQETSPCKKKKESKPVCNKEGEDTKLREVKSVCSKEKEVAKPKQDKSVCNKGKEDRKPREVKSVCSKEKEAAKPRQDKSICNKGKEDTKPREVKSVCSKEKEAAKPKQVKSVCNKGKEDTKPREVKSVCSKEKEAAKPKQDKSVCNKGKEDTKPRKVKSVCSKEKEGAKPKQDKSVCNKGKEDTKPRKVKSVCSKEKESAKPKQDKSVCNKGREDQKPKEAKSVCGKGKEDSKPRKVKSVCSKEKEELKPKKAKSVCSKAIEDSKPKDVKPVCDKAKVEESLCKKEKEEKSVCNKEKEVSKPKEKESVCKEEKLTVSPCGDEKKEEKPEIRVQAMKDKKKEPAGPPDQSPIMQCIAFCRRKKQANRPQQGKGVPPRDKKPCTSDTKIYKKIAELNKPPAKCEEEEKKKIEEKCEEKKEEKCEEKKEKHDMKVFVPCKYEDIKPGIRKSMEEKCDKKEKEEKCEKKEKSRCDEIQATGDDVVKLNPNCPKFKYSCPRICKEEKKCEESETKRSKKATDSLCIERQRKLVDQKNNDITTKLKEVDPVKDEKCEEKKEKNEMKVFIPCKYEDIKPGIRKSMEEKCDKKEKEEKCEKKEKSRCDIQATGDDVVKLNPNCPKFKYSCPQICKEEKKCEESETKRSKKATDSLCIERQRKLVDEKNNDITTKLKEVDPVKDDSKETKKEQRKCQPSAKLPPPCKYEEIKGTKKKDDKKSVSSKMKTPCTFEEPKGIQKKSSVCGGTTENRKRMKFLTPCKYEEIRRSAKKDEKSSDCDMTKEDGKKDKYSAFSPCAYEEHKKTQKKDNRSSICSSTRMEEKKCKSSSTLPLCKNEEIRISKKKEKPLVCDESSKDAKKIKAIIVSPCRNKEPTIIQKKDKESSVCSEAKDAKKCKSSTQSPCKNEEIGISKNSSVRDEAKSGTKPIDKTTEKKVVLPNEAKHPDKSALMQCLVMCKKRKKPITSKKDDKECTSEPKVFKQTTELHECEKLKNEDTCQPRQNKSLPTLSKAPTLKVMKKCKSAESAKKPKEKERENDKTKKAKPFCVRTKTRTKFATSCKYAKQAVCLETQSSPKEAEKAGAYEKETKLSTEEEKICEKKKLQNNCEERSEKALCTKEGESNKPKRRKVSCRSCKKSNQKKEEVKQESKKSSGVGDVSSNIKNLGPDSCKNEEEEKEHCENESQNTMDTENCDESNRLKKRKVSCRSLKESNQKKEEVKQESKKSSGVNQNFGGACPKIENPCPDLCKNEEEEKEQCESESQNTMDTKDCDEKSNKLKRRKVSCRSLKESNQKKEEVKQDSKKSSGVTQNLGGACPKIKNPCPDLCKNEEEEKELCENESQNTMDTGECGQKSNKLKRRKVSCRSFKSSNQKKEEVKQESKKTSAVDMNVEDACPKRENPCPDLCKNEQRQREQCQKRDEEKEQCENKSQNAMETEDCHQKSNKPKRRIVSCKSFMKSNQKKGKQETKKSSSGCKNESKNVMKTDDCHEKSKSRKEIVSVAHEKSAMAVRKSDDQIKREECDSQKEDKIKEFVPCKYEEIKPGIRKHGDGRENSECEEKQNEKLKTKAFVPCKLADEVATFKDTKPGVRHNHTDSKEDLPQKCCPKFRNPCPDFRKDEEQKECEEEDHSGENESCQSSEGNKDAIKEFVPCKYEEIKPGIRNPEKESEQKNKDIKKEFVPCKTEEIKPGIRNSEDGLKPKESDTKIKEFVPCKYEEIKPGIRNPEKESEQENKDIKKEFVPCKTEEIKPGIRNSEDALKPKESDTKIEDSVPCKDEETKPEIKKQKTDQEESKDVKKKFVPCKYEEIKPGIRNLEDNSEHEKSKHENKDIKEFVPCKYEEIKPGIRHSDEELEFEECVEELENTDGSEKNSIKVFVPCKYEDIKPGIRKTKEDSDSEECSQEPEESNLKKTCPKFRNPCPDFRNDEDCSEKTEESSEVKTFVPCKYEEIKPGIRHSGDDKGSDSKDIKVFVPCKYEEIKPGIRNTSDEKGENEEIKPGARHSEDDLEFEECVDEENSKSKSTIKEFVPCKYEEIKPGIRSSDDGLEYKECLEETELKSPDEHKQGTDLCPKGDTLGEIVRCQYEETNPGILCSDFGKDHDGKKEETVPCTNDETKADSEQKNNVIANATNTSLIITTVDQKISQTDTENKCAEEIEALKKELEICKKGKTQESTTLCYPGPKLDATLSKPPEQIKDFVGGMLEFFRNIYIALFMSKPTPKKPAKRKSEQKLTKKKSTTVVKRSKSCDAKIDATKKKVKKGKGLTKIKVGNCVFDLNPEYCQKSKKPKTKKSDKHQEKDDCGKKEETDRLINPWSSEAKIRDTGKKKETMEPCPTIVDRSAAPPTICEEDDSKKKTTTCRKKKLPSKVSCKKEKTRKLFNPHSCEEKSQSSKKEPKELIDPCSSEKKKSRTSDTCKKEETESTKPCPIVVCPDKKEESGKLIKPCPSEKNKEETTESKCSGLPDQSPIMKCVALCRRKKKEKTPQKGKASSKKETKKSIKPDSCKEKKSDSSKKKTEEVKKPCSRKEKTADVVTKKRGKSNIVVKKKGEAKIDSKRKKISKEVKGMTKIKYGSCVFDLNPESCEKSKKPKTKKSCSNEASTSDSFKKEETGKLDKPCSPEESKTEETGELIKPCASEEKISEPPKKEEKKNDVCKKETEKLIESSSPKDCHKKDETVESIESRRSKPCKMNKLKKTKSDSSQPSDQSAIMECIALCRLQKKANTPQKGKVPPRDKRTCVKSVETLKKMKCKSSPELTKKKNDLPVKKTKSVECTATKKEEETKPCVSQDEKDKTNKPGVPSDQCKAQIAKKKSCRSKRRRKPSKKKKPCVKVSKRRKPRKCNNTTKKKCEESKPVKEDNSKCENEKNKDESKDIKQFVPCKYEEIKPGIRHSDKELELEECVEQAKALPDEKPKHKEEAKTTCKDTVSPDQSPIMQCIALCRANKPQKGKVPPRDKKPLQLSSSKQQCEKNEKDEDVSSTPIKPCSKDEESRQSAPLPKVAHNKKDAFVKSVKSKERKPVKEDNSKCENKKNKEEIKDIKQFVPCKYEEIKPGIRHSDKELEVEECVEQAKSLPDEKPKHQETAKTTCKDTVSPDQSPIMQCIALCRANKAQRGKVPPRDKKPLQLSSSKQQCENEKDEDVSPTLMKPCGKDEESRQPAPLPKVTQNKKDAFVKSVKSMSTTCDDVSKKEERRQSELCESGEDKDPCNASSNNKERKKIPIPCTPEDKKCKKELKPLVTCCNKKTASTPTETHEVEKPKNIKLKLRGMTLCRKKAAVPPCKKTPQKKPDCTKSKKEDKCEEGSKDEELPRFIKPCKELKPLVVCKKKSLTSCKRKCVAGGAKENEKGKMKHLVTCSDNNICSHQKPQKDECIENNKKAEKKKPSICDNIKQKLKSLISGKKVKKSKSLPVLSKGETKKDVKSSKSLKEVKKANEDKPCVSKEEKPPKQPCQKKEESAKVFVPCRYEEIKSALRGRDANTSFENKESKEEPCEKEKKESTKVFVPCKYEEIKSALRGNDASTFLDNKESKEQPCEKEEGSTKVFVPCKYEEIKSALRGRDADTEKSNKDPDKDEKEDGIKIVPCKKDDLESDHKIMKEPNQPKSLISCKYIIHPCGKIKDKKPDKLLAAKEEKTVFDNDKDKEVCGKNEDKGVLHQGEEKAEKIKEKQVCDKDEEKVSETINKDDVCEEDKPKQEFFERFGVNEDPCKKVNESLKKESKVEDVKIEPCKIEDPCKKVNESLKKESKVEDVKIEPSKIDDKTEDVWTNKTCPKLKNSCPSLSKEESKSTCRDENPCPSLPKEEEVTCEDKDKTKDEIPCPSFTKSQDECIEEEDVCKYESVFERFGVKEDPCKISNIKKEEKSDKKEESFPKTDCAPERKVEQTQDKCKEENIVVYDIKKCPKIKNPCLALPTADCDKDKTGFSEQEKECTKSNKEVKDTTTDNKKEECSSEETQQLKAECDKDEIPKTDCAPEKKSEQTQDKCKEENIVVYDITKCPKIKNPCLALPTADCDKDKTGFSEQEKDCKKACGEVKNATTDNKKEECSSEETQQLKADCDKGEIPKNECAPEKKAEPTQDKCKEENIIVYDIKKCPKMKNPCLALPTADCDKDETGFSEQEKDCKKACEEVKDATTDNKKEECSSEETQQWKKECDKDETGFSEQEKECTKANEEVKDATTDNKKEECSSEETQKLKQQCEKEALASCGDDPCCINKQFVERCIEEKEEKKAEQTQDKCKEENIVVYDIKKCPKIRNPCLALPTADWDKDKTGFPEQEKECTKANEEVKDATDNKKEECSSEETQQWKKECDKDETGFSEQEKECTKANEEVKDATDNKKEECSSEETQKLKQQCEKEALTN